MTTPRQIPLDSQPNFRDLGGYAAAEGKQTRYALLYRSGNLDNLTASDRSIIRGLSIRTVVDFRSESEAQADKAFWAEQDTRYIHLPIDPGNLASLFWEAMRTGDSSALPEDILNVNNQLVIQEATSQYAELFQLLSHSENLPLLFNCTHGKDRTGIAAVLTLLALGVSPHDVKADYLLSNVYREQENQQQLQALRKSVQNKPNIDLNKLEAAFTILPHHFDTVLEAAKQRHGSLKDYFNQDLQADDAQIAAMRSNLLGDHFDG